MMMNNGLFVADVIPSGGNEISMNAAQSNQRTISRPLNKDTEDMENKHLVHTS